MFFFFFFSVSDFVLIPFVCLVSSFAGQGFRKEYRRSVAPALSSTLNRPFAGVQLTQLGSTVLVGRDGRLELVRCLVFLHFQQFHYKLLFI